MCGSLTVSSLLLPPARPPPPTGLPGQIQIRVLRFLTSQNISYSLRNTPLS